MSRSSFASCVRTSRTSSPVHYHSDSRTVGGTRFAGGINFAVFLPHTQETMSEIKLVYFDLRARGEPIRLVLETAGKKYEDVRLSFEEWPAEKPSKCC